MLPETQREAILFERSEERKRIQERNQLKRALRPNSAQGTREKKSRSKGSDSHTKAALSDLVARREKKHPTKRSHLFKADEDDDEDYEDDEVDDRKKFTPKKMHHQSRENIREMLSQLQLEDLKRVQVTRTMLEQWLDEPYWDKVIHGLFVRVGVGEYHAKGYVYKVAEIVEATDLGGKKYKIGKKTTSMTLKLNIAGSTKDFQMEYISNSEFTDEEFQSWKKTMEKHEYEPPTSKDLTRLEKNIEYAKNYVYTDEDSNRLIEENRKKALNKGIALDFDGEFIRLKKELKIAQEANDSTRIEEIKDAIRKLFEKKQKKMNQLRSGKYDLDAINKKNKEMNAGRLKKVDNDTTHEDEDDGNKVEKKVVSFADYLRSKGRDMRTN